MGGREGGKSRRGRKEGKAKVGGRGREHELREECGTHTHVGLPHKVLQVGHLGDEGSEGWLACKEWLVGGADGRGHSRYCGRSDMCGWLCDYS